MLRIVIGLVIGVVQDSVETALNSSSDAFFTAFAEFYDRGRKKVGNDPSKVHSREKDDSPSLYRCFVPVKADFRP